LAESPDGRFLYVANYFDDTVSVIDIEKKALLRHLLLNNNQPKIPPGSRRGEILFYDAKVSLHGWSSCNSCHVDGHTTGGLADTLSDGTMYTPKRIPSLLGTVGTGPWGWDGMKITLYDQVLQSMRVTMQGEEMKKDTPENAALIVDYLATLKLPVRASANPAHYRSGIKIFKRLGCNECHALPGLTSRKSFDVGLWDEKGWKLFNPPSLLGLRHGNRFLHDNRADSLNAVFTEHGHPDGDPPTGKDLQSILSFLRNL
jgi:cytochrome c peroxidase